METKENKENQAALTGDEAAKARYRDLTETPVPQLILRLSVPTIISMLVTAFYNAADTFFVGKISTDATAAVGLAFSVMAIIQAMGFFCGQGSGNTLSRMLGAGKKQEASEMASTGFALALILGVIFAGVAMCFLEPLVIFLGATTEDLVEQTMQYLQIILLGAPFMMGQFVINNQLRFQGSAMYAMVGLMCGAVLNVGLDPLLIFVFDMGVRGAALATILGQMASFFVLLLGSMRGVNLRLHIRNVKLNGHNLLQIINGGAPALFRQGLASVATILLNRAAGLYGGEAAIAGMSVATRTLMILSSALIGFGQGYQPVCAFNYGAQKKDRVREGYFFCVKYGTILLIIMAILCYAFAPQIIGWFRDDPEVVKVGAAALRWQAIALPLMAAIVITNMMLQSTGKGVKASITASARSGIFFIPLILILPELFGLFGVEIAQAVADVLAATLAIPLAVSELKEMK
ncbi:MAG: MATE family efflux transporter [Verrucomicrobia bacterium]|nr:MATE family efflux transporter [Verrucomicrobiota bacterium]